MKEKLNIADIRNKLSPLCTLINLIEDNSLLFAEDNPFIKYMQDSIKQSKISINYLAQREVYKLPND